MEREMIDWILRWRRIKFLGGRLMSRRCWCERKNRGVECRRKEYGFVIEEEFVLLMGYMGEWEGLGCK